MHITGASLHELPPLGNIAIKCDKRVNLFIGPNGTGKSTILRSLSHLYRKRQNVGGLLDEFGNNHLIHEVEVNGNVGQITEQISEDWTTLDSIRRIYIPASRINIGTLDNDEVIGNFVSPYTMSFSEVLNGDYIQRALLALHSQEPGENMEIALYRAFRCAQSICQEIILDGPHPHTEIYYDEERGRSVSVDPAMGIGTIDDARGAPLYAGVLSSGTQGTLLWIYALAIEMAGHYKFALDWNQKPAILLIDEIENHLHPTWQRRVIPALLDHFPNLQIFATTHSPFVVAGLKAGQIHLLKRDEKTGVVTATTNEEDIIGWTADEILRNMMGVDEPTDLLTIDRDKRLRELRRKETLTDEEESELTTLRRQVNEAHLSRSVPVEERESYANLMQRFLLTRQSDLSQDGG